MNGFKYYKRYIEKLISQEPVVITIERLAKTPDGYGGYTTSPLTATATVRIYNKNFTRGVAKESGEVIGFMAGNVDKILASGDADIISGDTFESGGKSYRVMEVNNYFDICKQVDLEVLAVD
jgi:hypothetical protein